MTNIGNFLDGRTLLVGSPFRSLSFLIASVAGAGSVALAAYLLFRHLQMLTVNAAVLLGVLIGAQLVYQWWRVLRYRSKIRALYLKSSGEDTKEGSPLDIAVRVAVGGLVDVLFFSYGIAFSALVLIGFLLFRLDGLR